jgi:hypothetical protein
MPQAVFTRIDTADNQPYFEGTASAEIAVSSLFHGRDQGWFDLVGFVVLPQELQLLIVPRSLAVSSLIINLETQIYPQLSLIKPISGTVLDPDFYREKVDCDEEVRQRIRWMHLAPVRARLATLAEGYPHTSANAKFQEFICPLPHVWQDNKALGARL